MRNFNVYFSGKAESLFGKMLHAEYYNIMAGCVRQCGTVTTETFQPLYDIGTNNATSEIREHRKTILGSAIVQDAETVEEELKAGWEKE